MKNESAVAQLSRVIPKALTRKGSAARERDPREALLTLLAAVGGNVAEPRKPLLQHRRYNRQLGLGDDAPFVALEFLEIAERQADELMPDVQGQMHVAIHPELIRAGKQRRNLGLAGADDTEQIRQRRADIATATQELVEARTHLRLLEREYIDPNVISGYLLCTKTDIDRRREAVLAWYLEVIFGMSRPIIAAALGALRCGGPSPSTSATPSSTSS